MKNAVLVIILLCSQNSYGQEWKEKVHFGEGLTYGSLNSIESLAGGLSIYLGDNFIETKNSSFSLSTNLKIGAEDKSGFAFPVLLILGALSQNSSANVTTNGINTFADLPLLLHYNFGLGATHNTNKRIGFYTGGGMNYLFTGYADTSGTSEAISFWGYTIDGGIRFGKGNETGFCADLNFATTFSLRQPIGQINKPKFFAITLSFYK